MSRRRTLTPDERDLWKRVTRRTNPLHPKTAEPPQPPTLAPAPDPVSPVLVPFRIGGARTKSAPQANLMMSVSERVAHQPVRMDRKTFGQLKKGKLAPEAHLDLHGRTLERAHADLTRFILNAFRRRLRLVLVITGKGKPSEEGTLIPERHGILKRQVPHWLAGPGLAHAVLQVAQAHSRHGGGGALYVYLRRQR